MSDIAIKVENLGKLYRLGEVGTGTISHDLNRWLARIRGKEDPFSTIGETNDRTSKGESNYVWALQDINFEIKKGEAVGIIGRNGAGKSTLLKLLSKVTKPTKGKIKVNGRIASLLEVGTGFHPEMTGRENIFLNGAIMGMTKREIKSKFDEIVDFAGVERYIDTPVKRYSSGMYVRLAFAVAAHLEPEILIVDEVLAVGDAEFQKKCLGKMKDVSTNDGRTVLFVSHNMAAIQNLCEHSLLLSKGTVEAMDKTSKIISTYNLNNSKTDIIIYDNKDVYISGFSIESLLADQTVIESAVSLERVIIKVEIVSKINCEMVNIGFGINDSLGNRVITPFTKHCNAAVNLSVGVNVINCAIPNFPLKPGIYQTDIYIGTEYKALQHYDEGLTFEVIPSVNQEAVSLPDSSQGNIIVNQIWTKSNDHSY